MTRTALVLALIAGLAGSAAAGILYVPGHYSTIQQALNAARSGDLILVAPGTYKENLAWPRVDGIRLIGVAGPARTIIDGNQKGRVISFGSGLTRATLLQGFTITGGLLKTTRNHGAGLYVGSSPTIRGNRITGNVGDGPSWNYGGGIHVSYNARPRIVGNVIRQNILRNGSWNYGAGIYVDRSARPEIVNNQILENENQSGSRGYGGGIFVGSTAPTAIVGNVVAGNVCKAGSWNYGGGIRVYSSAAALIVNNTIANNVCSAGTWRYGGGIEYSGTASGKILNNIIAGNTARSGGGIKLGTGATAPAHDVNDVWNNTGGNYAGLSAGPKSFSRDPLFAGVKDYHLTFRSPCLEVASAAALGTLADQDYDGDPRRLDGDLDGLKGDGAALDVGADEYSVAGLVVSGPPRLGTTITFDVSGPSGSVWTLLYSMATGSLFVDPYGIVLIGAPFGVLARGATPGKVPVPLPGAAALIGVTVHVQGIVAFVRGGQPVGHITGRLDLTFY